MKSFKQYINEAEGEVKQKTPTELEIEKIDSDIERLKKQNEKEKSSARDIKIIKLNDKKKELAVQKAKDNVTEDVLEEDKNIINMYKKAGLVPPKGKGIHTDDFHKLSIKVAQSYMKKGMSQDDAFELAYPTAMKQLGKEKAVKKGHLR